MEKTPQKNNNLLWLVLLALFLIPAALPLLKPGFFHFSDEPHIANLFQMYRGFISRQLPPRWAPDMIFGYGYPLFNFYYPLPFYLGSLLYHFSGSLVFSLKAVFLLTIPLSAYSMYAWLRKHTDHLAAFAGSLIYIYTPYRAVDLYVRGALGEVFSFAIAPLVALTIYNSIKSRKLRHIGFLALSVALFVLGHNLAPLLFFPWFVLYGLVLAINFQDLKSLLRPLLGGLLGLAISAYWWLPAFVEKNLLRPQTPFNYQDHFPFIKQLIFSPFEYGASNPGIGDDISFQVGIVNWLLIILVAFLFFKLKPKLKRLAFIFLAGIGSSLFLMNIRSSFLWEFFALSVYVQFPWRLLLMTTFLTSSLVIFLDLPKFRDLVLIILASASFLLTFTYFRPSEYFHPSDDYFLNRFFANISTQGETSQVSQDYLHYSEDYLLLPKWAKHRPQKLPSSLISSQSNLEIERVEKLTPVHYQAFLHNTSSENQTISVNLLFFPGWQVFIDGDKKMAQKLSPLGNIGIQLPPGQHQLVVKWAETPLRRKADLVSLFALASTISLVTLFSKRQLKV